MNNFLTIDADEHFYPKKDKWSWKNEAIYCTLW